MTECPEKFQLEWLNQMIDRDEQFVSEALAIWEDIESYQPSHRRKTNSRVSAAIELVNYWLVQRELQGYKAGDLLDNFGALIVMPAEECYRKGIEIRQSSIFVVRDELVELMRSEGMTVPFYLKGGKEIPAAPDKPSFHRLRSLPAANEKTTFEAGSATSKTSRIVPAGGDSLTPVIWGICYDLDAEGRKVTARPVMAELKRRAEAKTHPLVEGTLGGVKYEYEKGQESELDSEQLRKRIGEWRKSTGG